MTVANKIVNTFAAASIGLAAYAPTPSFASEDTVPPAAAAQSCPVGQHAVTVTKHEKACHADAPQAAAPRKIVYRTKIVYKDAPPVQQPASPCDESLQSMAVRAKVARATATENNSFLGGFPTPFTSKEEGASVEINHAYGKDAFGHADCSHREGVTLTKREITKSFMDHVDELAGPTVNAINGPMRIINNVAGGTATASPTINGSTATVTGSGNSSPTITTYGGTATATASPTITVSPKITTSSSSSSSSYSSAAAQATAKQSQQQTQQQQQQQTQQQQQQDWLKKGHKDLTGCGCGDNGSSQPSQPSGYQSGNWGTQTPNGSGG